MPDLRKFFSASELKGYQDFKLEEIEENFSEAVEVLKEQKIDATYTTFVNREGTIDAELRIRTIPRFKSFAQVMTILTDSLGEPIDDTWVSFGLLFQPKADDNPYDKYEGYNLVRANYQNSDRWQLNALTAGHGNKSIYNYLKEADRGRVVNIIYNVHWNAMTEKPKR